MAAQGMLASGLEAEADLVEILEIPDHPWFIATIYHPEYKSRPNKSHPHFKDFIKTIIENKEK